MNELVTRLLAKVDGRDGRRVLHVTVQVLVLDATFSSSIGS